MNTSKLCTSTQDTTINIRYRNIKFKQITDLVGNIRPYRLKDGDPVYCQFCIKRKIGGNPLSLIEYTKRYLDKTTKTVEYLHCVNCETIYCKDCFTMLTVLHNGTSLRPCDKCKRHRIQESKPTKECECGCKYRIPVTDLKGNPLRFYKNHNLLLINKPRNKLVNEL